MFEQLLSDAKKKILELALKKNILKITVELTITRDKNVVAKISSLGITKEIAFSHDELLSIVKNDISRNSAEKINKILSAFPDTNEPSPKVRGDE